MTLVETLVASVIAVIVLGGAGMLMFQSVHTQRDAELLSYANNMAREKVESLKALGYENIPVGEAKEETPDGNFVLYTTVVSDTDPVTGYPLRVKTLTIKVYTVRERVFGATIGGAASVEEDAGLVATHVTRIHKRGL
jgi:type II secretory pathway pseudopilin PulG